MTGLGLGLGAVDHRRAERLRVTEAELAIKRRLEADEEELLVTRSNLAVCLFELERDEESLQMRREILADSLRLNGPDDEDAILDAEKLVESLIEANLFKEAMSLLRDTIPTARRVLGEENDLTLCLRSHYACAISYDTNSSRARVHKAVAILKDVLQTSRRVFGNQHPIVEEFLRDLENTRMRLADDESREALGAAPAPTRRRRHRRRPK